MDHVIVLAPRKPPYTRASFQAHYEAYHAPLFYKYTQPAIASYLRNHIVEVLGDDPPFDTLSEFAIRPAMRGWMGERLRAPETRDLEADVQRFLAERGNAFPVDEELIAGTPRAPAVGGPVRKRVLLLRRPAATPVADFATAARRFARELPADATRTTLTLWQQDKPPPVDAMIAVWAPEPPAPLAAAAPRGVDVAFELDVDEYCSAWLATAT
jgi:hypothetical protein